MVYVILADDFEEIEAIEPIDILRRGGVNVKILSVMDTLEVKGAHGILIKADMSISEADPRDMDMLMLPGGAGHTLLDSSNEVHSLINYALTNNKYIAAICASPSILGKKHLLTGKKATCYPGFEEFCYGAEMIGAKAVKDGMIITGRGPGAASDFGFLALSVLKDDATVSNLKEAMQYND